MLKIGILLTILSILSNSMIDPALVPDHLKAYMPKQARLLTMDLGRTVNGFTIMAYGFTMIPNVPVNPQPSTIQKLPSILLTSFLHPRDDHAVEMMLLYLTVMLQNLSQDFSMQYILGRGILWVIPFVNIDGYELLIRRKKLSLQQRIPFAKNSNMNADPYNNLNHVCEQAHEKGVNIDNNFWHWEALDSKICSESYGGYEQFSQLETKNLKAMIQNLNIKLLINLEAGGSGWIFPNLITDRINENGNSTDQQLAIYQNIRSQLWRNSGVPVGSNTQIRKGQNRGGFIEWAASQGIIAFTFLIGEGYVLFPEEFNQQAKQAIPMIDLLIRKNAPGYVKFRNSQLNQLYIRSTSIANFTLEIKVASDDGRESLSSEHALKPGDQIKIDINLASDPQTLQITLKIIGTGAEETVNLSEIKLREQTLQAGKPQNQSLAPWYKILKFSIAFLAIWYFFRCRNNHNTKNSQEKEKI